MGHGSRRCPARFCSDALSAAGQESLTETGLAVGTPTYMSTEQAGGDREVDARSDVYSLGRVLYEMLAGQPPYTGATAEAIRARKSLEAVPSLRVVRASVPSGIEQAITKGPGQAAGRPLPLGRRVRRGVGGCERDRVGVGPRPRMEMALMAFWGRWRQS